MKNNLRIVYDCPKDGLAKIVIPVADLPLEEIAKKSVPKGVDFRIIDASALPQSREFRGAWTDKNDTDTVDVDMEKARKIHLDRIRAKRNKKLEELDKEQIIAIGGENQAKIKAVERRKQTLRDLPITLKLDDCRTPEELSAVLPKELED